MRCRNKSNFARHFSLRALMIHKSSVDIAMMMRWGMLIPPFHDEKRADD